MKGKKTDPEFISLFIQDSVKEGSTTPDEIVSRAKKMIIEIDDQIRSVELIKKTRSKLLDVISSFESIKKDKAEDARLLPFFELKYPDICKKICHILKNDNFTPNNDHTLEVKFCFKQLIAAKIIERVGDQIMQGERFDEYMTFVLREDI